VQFARSWAATRSILVYGRGAYQWLTDADPAKQAEHIVRLLERTGDMGELAISIDWEEPGTVFRGERLVLHALGALRRARELTGNAVLYTGAWYVRQYVASDRDIDRVVSRELLDELCSYPLWHAEYSRPELRDRRACATEPVAIRPPRLGKIWSDRGIVQAVHQFDGDGGCLLPNGVDADFDVATPEGLARVLRIAPTTIATREQLSDLSTLGPATPLRAGEGEHTIDLDEEEDGEGS